MSARDVIDAIDDAVIIRDRHPALFMRVSAASGTCLELRTAYDCWLAGITSPYWFSSDHRYWGPRRRARRKANKAARAARRHNR